jgi:hypothetical protein
MPDAASLADLARTVGALLERVAPQERALLLALAERLAAARYRAWAAEVADPAARQGLLACADREEAIASRVEASIPGAAAIQRDLQQRHPELLELNRSLFAGRPLADQLTMQARGELAGAAAWRAFAARESDPKRREAFLACAPLEEENSAALEKLLARQS